MAGEENGLALGGPIDHALQELASDHRVQSGGRLVEDQQFRLMRQRQRQRHLGVRSFRQRLELLLGRKAELGHQPGVLRQEPGAIKSSREPADLLDRHPLVERGWVGGWVVGGWWLVVGGWLVGGCGGWLVVGGWLVSGWWLVSSSGGGW